MKEANSKEPEFSDYVVYVDESGHASPDPDPNYPCFVLAFCLFEKNHYLSKVAPALQQLKFNFFGHDMVIFHERDIRKRLGPFTILNNPRLREEFYASVNGLMEKAELEILSSTILKEGNHLPEDNLYHLALGSCLEQLFTRLLDMEKAARIVHVVFEMRGGNEDKQLELEFLRLCNGENKHQTHYPFVPIFASKKANSTGLQFADLVARPIGLHKLRPSQINRAYDILHKKTLPINYQQTDLKLW